MKVTTLATHSGTALDVASRLLEHVKQGRIKELVWVGIDADDPHLFVECYSRGLQYTDLLMAERMVHRMADNMDGGE